MTVSVPEKTLEHWASQYLTYRYKSKVSLWWPTRGEDVDVRSLPHRPGKAVQLEMKTATPRAGNSQEVRVDLAQLARYRSRPLYQQPFYVFPLPPWTGNIARAASMWRVAPSELAFSRVGRVRWFANWLHVLTAAQVESVVAPGGLSGQTSVVPLVRFDPKSAVRTWGRGTVANPTTIAWRDLWKRLELCGQADWPQIVRVPAAIMAAEGDLLTSASLRQLLTRSTSGWDGDGDLETIAAFEGGFDTVALPMRSEPIVVSQTDHRQVVFMDADIWRDSNQGSRAR